MRPTPCSAALALFLGFVASASAADVACQRPVSDLLPVLHRMERSWSRVSDYTSRLVKTERFVDGTLTKERGIIHFRKPNQLHLRVVEGPNAGAEVLFPKPGTDDVILGRPGGVSGTVAGFLVSLPAVGGLIPHEFDLHDPRLLDGQHHPLPDSSLGGMIRLIATNVRIAARRGEGGVCFHASEVVAGHRSTKIEVHLPADRGLWHTVAEGETLWSIGEDYGQDRYVILYNNGATDEWDDLPPGTRIFIPRYYAPRAVIWISEDIDLPVRLRLFDDQGRLYESYTNAGLAIDVGLDDEDFDPARHGFPAGGRADRPAERKAQRDPPARAIGIR